MTQSFAEGLPRLTGAARGIGDTIAARLIADGAKVFSLDKQRLTKRGTASPISRPM